MEISKSLTIATLMLLGCSHFPEQSARNVADTQDAPTKSLVCNVHDFEGGGRSETEAVQAAVDACKGKGGTVFFLPGTYSLRTIRLGSQMTLRIDSNVTLVGIKDSKAYPLLNPQTPNTQLSNCKRALLYAESADDLTIEGPGTIDGSGDFKEWQDVKEAERPMAIFIFRGTNLRMQNLHVKNAAMWAVVLMETYGANVSLLDVDSRIGNTRDGIDIVDGSDIHLDRLTIFSEDDSICLKSGMPSGLRNVWVTNSQIQGSLVANGLKFGTASMGTLSNIHFEHISIENVAQAAMALESVDGSQIDGVTFDDIRYKDTGTAIFMILGWRDSQASPHEGNISNITFQNIQGSSSKESWGSAISGSESTSITHLLFKNVKMQFKGDDKFSENHLPNAPAEYQGQYPDPRMWPDLPSQGLYFRHVKDVVFQNVKLIKIPSKDARPTLIPANATSPFDAP